MSVICVEMIWNQLIPTNGRTSHHTHTHTQRGTISQSRCSHWSVPEVFQKYHEIIRMCGVMARNQEIPKQSVQRGNQQSEIRSHKYFDILKERKSIWQSICCYCRFWGVASSLFWSRWLSRGCFVRIPLSVIHRDLKFEIFSHLHSVHCVCAFVLAVVWCSCDWSSTICCGNTMNLNDRRLSLSVGLLLCLIINTVQRLNDTHTHTQKALVLMWVWMKTWIFHFQRLNIQDNNYLRKDIWSNKAKTLKLGKDGLLLCYSTPHIYIYTLIYMCMYAQIFWILQRR